MEGARVGDEEDDAKMAKYQQKKGPESAAANRMRSLVTEGAEMVITPEHYHAESCPTRVKYNEAEARARQEDQRSFERAERMEQNRQRQPRVKYANMTVTWAIFSPPAKAR